MRKMLLVWVTVLVVAVIASVAATNYYLRGSARERVIVSTTTSLYDTELLDAVEAEFEAKYPIDLNFISVGTGIAIQHAQRGDADLILVHSPPDEKNFLTGGIGVNRKIAAYNFFAIVGPVSDPVQIESLQPLQALSKIAENGRNGMAKWVSRGDNSGTHSKEKSLWASAGFTYADVSKESWYINAGSGMGETLKKADYFDAYTLADTGTYLKYYNDGLITLEVLIKEEKDLLNVYSAIAVNQTLHPSVNFNGAMTFIKWLISEEGQQIIEDFGKETYSQSLFSAAVKVLKENTDPTIAQWIKGYAYFNGTECPSQYRIGYAELYP
ncbi:MAG TPA: substrate-binding domain-containing protein [Candidatus Bathyarchaeia archaeon]|nr:substrate-binding domain-containing protein [Candidatus Bathyarchaeia archaeon]